MQKFYCWRKAFPHLAAIVSTASLAIVFASAVCAQNAGDSQEPGTGSTLKVQSNLVVIRAVVRDGRGKPVNGLAKEDFRIFDRGKEQSVVQFEEESATSNPSTPPPVPGHAAAPPSATDTDRFIALYFDDLNTSAADLMQARDAADRYFTANLRPRDHIAVFTATKALTNFTSDPRQLHEALFQLNASSRVPARVHECPDLSDYQAMQMVQDSDMQSSEWVVALAEVKICAPPPDPRGTAAAIRMLAERIAARSQGMARDNLSMISQVVKYIAGAPGSRTVVLVSPGFLTDTEELTIDRTIDRALRAQVVINSLDPKGLSVLLREGDASNGSMILPDPHATAARHHLDREKEFMGADVLAEVAQGTGGEFFHDDNDLRAGFDRLAGHPDEYVLAFAPGDIKLDGKFHEVKITFAEKQKGYTIQARRGYFAVKPEAAAEPALAGGTASAEPDHTAAAPLTSAEHTAEGSAGHDDSSKPSATPESDQQRLQDALRSTKDSADLAVGMEASPSEGEGATRLLALTVHLDTKSLPLRSQNAYHADAVTFAVAVFDQNNQVVEVKQRNAKLSLTDDQLTDFLNDGLDVNMMFEVKPATYRLRVAVIETNEHKVAAFSRSVAVP